MRKDNTVFDAEFNVSTVKVNGKPSELVFIRDISERKAIENELRAASKRNEVLLREVHHRVKNNLQVLSSLVNLQMRHTKDEVSKAELGTSEAALCPYRLCTRPSTSPRTWTT